MKRRALWLIGAGTLLVAGAAYGTIWGSDGSALLDPLATAAVGHAPVAIALDVRTSRAFVVNYLDTTISVLDTGRGQVVRTLGLNPRGRGERLAAIAVDTRIDRAYAASWGFAVGSTTSAFVSTITILDARRAFVVKAVSLPGRVRDVAVDERGGRVFVLTDGNAATHGAVSALDAASGSLLYTVPVGASPVALAIDRRTGRLLVANQGLPGPGSFMAAGTVSVLDARSGRLMRGAPVGPRPMGIVVDERTGRAFISNNFGGSISVIDTRVGRLLATRAVGPAPDAMAVDQQAGHLFVADVAANTVSMLDARTDAVLRTVRVGIRPLVVAVDARAHRVLVANDVSGTVSVLDSVTGVALRTIKVGLDPEDAAVDERAGRAFILNLNADGERPSGLPLVSRIQALFRRITSQPARDPVGSVSILDVTH